MWLKAHDPFVLPDLGESSAGVCCFTAVGVSQGSCCLCCSAAQLELCCSCRGLICITDHSAGVMTGNFTFWFLCSQGLLKCEACYSQPLEKFGVLGWWGGYLGQIWSTVPAIPLFSLSIVFVVQAILWFKSYSFFVSCFGFLPISAHLYPFNVFSV